MTDAFAYAKDNRSEEQVKRFFDRGIANQRAAAEQFVLDMRLEHPTDDIGVRENEGDEFGKVQIYKPDFVGWYNNVIYPLEIKVPERHPEGTFDFKKNQIDALVRIGGYILIATPEARAFVRASFIKLEGELLFSERLGNKPCYRIDVAILPFKYWLHAPEFKKYNGGFYELLALAF